MLKINQLIFHQIRVNQESLGLLAQLDLQEYLDMMDGKEFKENLDSRASL